MRVAVIIPVCDGTERLAQCLTCLEQQHVKPAEVIVIDDGSHEPPALSLGKRFPRVRWIRNETSVGPGRARNLGVALSTSEALAFTDSDCQPPPDWVAIIQRELTEHQVITGPLQHETNILGWATAISSFGSFQRHASGYHQNFISSNFAIRAWTLGDLRFDPRLPFASEDLVLSETLRQRDVDIYYCKDLTMKHRPTLSLRDVLRRTVVYGRGFLPARRIMPSLPASKLAKLGRASALPISSLRFGLDVWRLCTLRDSLNIPLWHVPTMLLTLSLLRCGYAYGILTGAYSQLSSHGGEYDEECV